MHAVMSFFDYIFYRCYLFFNRHQNPDSARDNAANIVTIVQGFLVLDLFGVVREFYEFQLPHFNKYLYFLPLAVVFYVLNHVRYDRKLRRDDYGSLHARWSGEPENVRRRNGWLIVFLIFFVVFGVIALTAIF